MFVGEFRHFWVDNNLLQTWVASVRGIGIDVFLPPRLPYFRAVDDIGLIKLVKHPDSPKDLRPLFRTSF